MLPSDRLPDAVGAVADAVKGNWVDRHAPAATRPFLRLSRADRPIGTWLLFIPCLWGLALAAAGDGWRPQDIWIILGCGLGAFLMRGAGCTWNDISDRDFDASVARTRSRPIPSGQVTVRAALLWMVVQAVLAALILFSFNRLAIQLGIASLVLVAVYPFAKRFTWWPQAFLGLAFNWGAVLAFAAHAGTVSPGAIGLYAAGIAWTLFYDTIYAHQDKDDDALIGVRSTARLFGDRTPFWLAIFLVLSVLLMSAAVIFSLIDGSLLKLVIGIGAPWAMGWHLFWQLRRFDGSDSDGCMHLFRSNRDAGLIAALFLAIAAFL